MPGGEANAVVPMSIRERDCLPLVKKHESLFTELSGKRVFLTGGTGFFGSWFLEMATCAADTCELDFTIEVLSRDPSAFAKARPHLARHRTVRLRQGDVTSFDMPEGHFDAVAHFGSTGSKSDQMEKPQCFFEMIVNGTKRVIELAENSGSNHFLLASTGAVYGQILATRPVAISENQSTAPDPLRATSANAEGKRVAEFLCSCLSRRNPDMSVSIARGFAFLGPYLPEGAGFAALDFIRDLVSGSAIRVGGDGTPFRSYMYGSDLALWLWTLLLRAPKGCQAWNVGSDHPVTITELAREVATHRSPSPEVIVAKSAPADQIAHSYVPNVYKAETDFGLRLTVPLNEAIARTLAFYSPSIRKTNE